MVYSVNEYKVIYEEEKLFFDEYIQVVTVYKDKELILSSRDKTKEEFLNYLSYLVDGQPLFEIGRIYKYNLPKEEQETMLQWSCEYHGEWL